MAVDPLLPPAADPPAYGAVDEVSPPPEGSSDNSSPSQALISPSQITLRGIYRDPNKRRPYAQAMSYQTVRKIAEMGTTSVEELLGLLAGVQLSGILKAKTFTTLNGSFFTSASCLGHNPVYDTETIAATSAGVSLEEMIDHHFGVSLDTMTYAAAVTWFVAYSALPLIQRPLLRREQACMEKIVDKPLLPPRNRTVVSSISWLLEYGMPLTFYASRNALFIKALEKGIGYLRVYIEKTQNFSAGQEDLTANGWVHFDRLETVTEPGEALLSNTNLYQLMGAGILMYGIQALCNFHHDLQGKESDALPRIDFRRLMGHWKQYGGALLSRAANKGTQVLNDVLRSSLSILAGLQLSGALKAHMRTLLVGGFGLIATCTGHLPIWTDVPVEGASQDHTLGDQLDQALIVSLDTMTYAAAGAWLLGNLLIPRIQRNLQTKEDTLMRQIVGEGPLSPLAEGVKTGADRLNALFEFLSPVALYGASYALLFQAFEKSKGVLTVYSENPELWKDGDGSFVVNMAAGIYELIVSITSDEIPVPPEALGVILALGVVMYLSQAWMEYHRDLQKKALPEPEPAKPLPITESDTDDGEA